MAKIKNLIIRFFSAGIIAATLLVLILNPGNSSNAVKEALNVCVSIIIPSLLPFFFISGLIASMGFADDLARLIRIPFRRFSSAAAYACTPFLLGIIGGYPIGATALAELVKDNKISSKEAEKLLPFCNNTGPAFIIGAVGSGIFASGKAGLMLYGCHIASAVTLAVFSLYGLRKEPILNSDPDKSYPTLLRILPNCVRVALDKCLSICAFVIFFAVIADILKTLGITSAIALVLNKTIAIEIGTAQSLIAGILELGGGIASMYGASADKSSLALAAFVLGFGSLSVHCQTLAVVSDAKIKCARHFVGRIIHGAISAGLVYIFAGIIRI